jgi:membrane protein
MTVRPDRFPQYRDRPCEDGVAAARLLVWRVWERMLEIEFLDRSVALAGKAFVSFFPLVIVVAAFMPESVRTAIIANVTVRLGLRGEALTLARGAFASSDEVRQASGVLGLVMTFFFASSFTTALQRVYVHAWRRPRHGGAAVYWRGLSCLAAVLVATAVLGRLGDDLDGGVQIGLFGLAALAATSGLWWFIAWFLLLGDVRARVLAPTGLITGVAMALYAASATIWMPEVVTSNQQQFGVFGVALALVTWFSGAAIAILVGACAGVVLAEDPGRIGGLVRGADPRTLTDGAHPPIPAPAHELSLRDAFHSTDDS